MQIESNEAFNILARESQLLGGKHYFFITMQITFVYKFIYPYSFFSDLYANMQVLGYTPNKIEITKGVHKGSKGQVHSSAHPAH